VFSVGYAFGEADDDSFSGSRTAGGPYVGLTVVEWIICRGLQSQYQPKKIPKLLSRK